MKILLLAVHCIGKILPKILYLVHFGPFEQQCEMLAGIFLL